MLKQKVDNPRYPQIVTITRVECSDNPFDGASTERVLYSGVGRSFTDTTTTGGSQVDVNKRKSSIPVRFDKWEEPILDGDTIKTTKDGRLLEIGRVRDFEPDNNRTLIYWDLVRV